MRYGTSEEENQEVGDSKSYTPYTIPQNSALYPSKVPSIQGGIKQARDPTNKASPGLSLLRKGDAAGRTLSEGLPALEHMK